MHRGYIKIWRKIQDSFIWQNPKALVLFTHLLMEANYKDTEFMMNYKKLILKRGQLVCGRKKLSIETGISEGTIYKMMEMFEHEQLIEQQKTNLYTIVTMVNYNKYQDFEQQNEQQTIQQAIQQTIQPANTSKELINIKRTNKNDNEVFKEPTIEEIKSYCLERNNGWSDNEINHFIDFYGSKGWMVGKNKMKNWKFALHRAEKWERISYGSKPTTYDPDDIRQYLSK